MKGELRPAINNNCEPDFRTLRVLSCVSDDSFEGGGGGEAVGGPTSVALWRVNGAWAWLRA